MRLQSQLIASIGLIVLLGSTPFLIWMSKPGFSIAKRTLLWLVLLVVDAAAVLLILQLWVNTSFLLTMSALLTLVISVFTLGQWWHDKGHLGRASKYEKLAAKAQEEGNTVRAQLYRDLAQKTRDYYGRLED